MGALSPGIKWKGHEADHSPPTSAKVKKMWIDISTPPYAFVAWATLHLQVSVSALMEAYFMKVTTMDDRETSNG
jgi:hypothetical protein